MKRTFLWVLLIGVPILSLFAVPAFPEPFEVVQPDGYRFSAQIIGDEFFHYIIETESGCVIRLDEESNYWVHAPLPGVEDDFPFLPVQGGSAERIAPPSKEAIEAAREKALTSGDFYLETSQRKRSAPTTGMVKIPVILINFSDRSTTYTNAQFDQLIFGNYPALAPMGR